MANYFQRNLKYLREKKGLSKNKLGELTGVNQTTIGRWENGEISPTIDNVIDLMNALNIPLDELGTFLGKNLENGEKIMTSSDEDFKKILRNKGIDDNNITEEDAKKLIDFAIANKDYVIKK